ncbi:hypothetical protein DY000_02014610 [Brassica cretica]|uniref:Uncharacterized protein n=1 Tax=Brassica cretica TaxID=69181 RepID=A0ABQ7D432_BRACR|nr:hypothetical protein DY000_02014610 [Brassica cretica]
MEGSSYRNIFISRRKGVVPGTGPGVLPNEDPGRLLPGTQRPGITCALKSTGVAHSQQASPRQDLAPVILLF